MGGKETNTVFPDLSDTQNIPCCLLDQCEEPITEHIRMFQEGLLFIELLFEFSVCEVCSTVSSWQSEQEPPVAKCKLQEVWVWFI